MSDAVEELKQKFANWRSGRPSADTVARWRLTGCCTECGHPVSGCGVDVIENEIGVKFFGAPHQIGDAICFWCMANWCLDTDAPSPWPTGHG